MGGDDLAGGDADCALDALVCAECGAGEGFHACLHRTSLAAQKRAALRQLIAAASPPKQDDSQRLLKLANVPSQRRLARAERPRGGGKAAMLGDGGEGADQIPIKIFHGSLFICEYHWLDYGEF